MKKIIAVLFAVAALLILVNASEWEGSAAASVGFDFPEPGFFAATGSFPRNTVVEITNLENNKTIQVIITSGLDNPGLLAILSPEAAEAIGLQARSIGRVRMSVAADSSAVARFSGAALGSGDFDYDPAAMIAAAGISPDFFEQFLAWELYSAASNRDPSYNNAPYDELPLPEETLAFVETPVEANSLLASEAAQTEPTVATSEVPQADETSLTSAASQASVSRHELEDFEIRLVRADEQAPNELPPGIDPNYIIAPIPQPLVQEQVTPIRQTPLVQAQPAPVQQQPPLQQVEPQPVQPQPVQPTQPTPIIQSPLQPTQQPNTVTPPVVAIYSPVPEVLPSGFSVPTRNDPENGYYIQLVSGHEIAGIESEIRKIGTNMPSAPLVVQPAIVNGRQIYRLLLGPVNLGESGALLQRFRASYQDAFVLQYPR
ncbi:MAG: SPOR domain-containing protein [Treponema sp.]|jgi:hypothetical protein|nr:SPOR domain-containing protein [Treponema sp.]